jgi:tripartite-type tricarboxylate transporter receptor subunit TctC
MKVHKRNITNLIGGFLMLAVLAGACKTQAEAASAADFYKNKKITYMVASTAGGETDICVRRVAPYLQKYTGASAVIIENVPQAGGVVALNKLWNAKPEGLMLLTAIPHSVVGLEVGEQSGVQFQSGKFNVIFALENEKGNVLVVSAKGPLQSIDDMKKAKGLKSACLMGKAYTAAYFADLLGLDAKITPGMATGDARMALLRGEINFFPETVTGTLDGIATGNLRPLCLDISTSVAPLPQVPSVTKFASLSPQQKEWVKISDATNRGKYAFAGPNVPKDRIDYLRNVFERIHQDPQFLQERKKGERYPGGAPWVNGIEAQKDFTNYLNLAKGKEHDHMEEYLSKKYFTLK